MVWDVGGGPRVGDPVELGMGAARGLPYKDSPQFFLSSGAKASMKPLYFMNTFRWATYSSAPSAGGKAPSHGNGAKVSIPKAGKQVAVGKGLGLPRAAVCPVSAVLQRLAIPGALERW